MNKRIYLSSALLMTFVAVIVGLAIGYSLKSYPTAPPNWWCNDEIYLRQGYQLCHFEGNLD